MSEQESKPELKKVTRAPQKAAEPKVDYDKLSDMVASKMMILMRSTPEVDTRNMTTAQPSDIVLRDGDPAVGGGSIETTPGKSLTDSYLAELAFMEEDMIVRVAETSDENEENPVIVGNNGQFKLFFRGQDTVAKRRHVSELICKTGRVTTPEVQVPGIKGGTERSFSIVQKTAHKYPFSVIRDDNPRGSEWLRRRLNDEI